MAKCPVCESKKGKRNCSKENSIICSKCCASIRNEDECFNCTYFNSSDKSLNISQEDKDIVMKINNDVDNSLMLMKHGNLEEGKLLLDKLLLEYPQNHMVNYGMGVFFNVQQVTDKAIHFFKKAIKVHPYFVEAYFNLAIAYRQKSDLKNSLENFQKVVEFGDKEEDFVKAAKGILDDFESKLLKNDGITLNQYLEGMLLFEKAHKDMIENKWDLAKKGFNNVLTITPNHIQSLGNLGLCYGMLNDNKKALEFLNKALELEPNYEFAKSNKEIISNLSKNESLADFLESN